MLKQIFESEKISFVEVSESLADDYLIMVNDYENVNRFLGRSRKVYTKQDEVEWVKKKLDDHEIVYSMIEKESGDFIGNIEYMDVDESSKELGIAITAKMQDKGLGTEAISRMIEYGFNDLGLKKIVLKTDPDNCRAIHVYVKCGFKEYDRNENDVFMEICR
ncbi:MAG: GNAT family N-acetyltransferase [Erysipelotrichaceae bacterium]|nr:GNAT family N-acetyltransferase [Erysipelotrichaceae bacterium]